MSGTFASIERKFDNSGACLAYKTYNKTHGKMVLQHYRRELYTLKKLQETSKESSNKRHVISLLDCQETSSSFQLIFPFYNLTLQNYLGKKNVELAERFVSQICQGLLFLQDNGVVHCDLSPSNILMDDVSGQMIISDFGCAHSISDDKTDIQEEIGTRYYKAPEHLFGYKIYRFSTDVWSMGAIFAEILFGYPIFAGESDIEQIGRIVNRLGKPSFEVEQEEMSAYPDANKLMFFSCSTSDDDDEEYDFSDDEDYDLIIKSRIPITKMVEDDNIMEPHKRILLGILTWSTKNRFTVSDILKIVEYKQLE